MGTDDKGKNNLIDFIDNRPLKTPKISDKVKNEIKSAKVPKYI